MGSQGTDPIHDSRMDRYSLRFPDELIDDVDAAVENGEYYNRSQAIRAACQQVFADE